MKTNTITPDDGTDLRDPSPTTLFEAFASPRRQRLLQYLAHKPGAVLLGDLAEYIAIAEGEPTRDRYERVLVSLSHQHVPHLVDAGLVQYDGEREMVTLSTDPETIRPYVDLASLSSLD